jgi:hypothetical protein
MVVLSSWPPFGCVFERVGVLSALADGERTASILLMLAVLPAWPLVFASDEDA